MIFYSDLMRSEILRAMKEKKNRMQQILGVGSWLHAICSMLAEGGATTDHGTVQLFLEQYWAAHSPAGIHLSSDALLSGLPAQPEWPAQLPDQLLITMDQRWALGGVKVPAIFVTRAVPASADGGIVQRAIDYVMRSEGLDATIGVTSPDNVRWIVSARVPDRQAFQSEWFVSHLSAAHIHAMIAAENGAQYVENCAALNVELGAEGETANVVFETHRLVVAMINQMKLNLDSQVTQIPTVIKQEFCGRRIKVKTHYINGNKQVNDE